MPARISSDIIKKYVKEHQKMMEYTRGEAEYIPVDLNNARTDFSKGDDKASLDKAGKDVRYRFDMDNLAGGGE